MQVFASGFALLLAALQGETYVADGATLVIGNTPVQLEGIDVPSARTPDGALARAEMQAIVAGKIVTCRTEGARGGAPQLAVCQAGGADIAAELVSRGYALDCSEAPGRYRALEPQGARERLAASVSCADR